MKDYYVYILTTTHNKILYTGVTNDLKRRICEHKGHQADSFTKKYHIEKLVYFETFSDPQTAIEREKQIKRWVRQKKNTLVQSANPDWKDLSESLS